MVAFVGISSAELSPAKRHNCPLLLISVRACCFPNTRLHFDAYRLFFLEVRFEAYFLEDCVVRLTTTFFDECFFGAE